VSAALAAALLAAGCDYWKNLVDDRSVTQASLTVAVVDAWTRDTITNAACADPAHGINAITDATGRFRIADIGTGRYTLTCRADYYYEGSKSFDVSGEGSSAKVELARHGFEEWYPDEPVRQIGLPGFFDTLRYPPRFVLATIPDNDGSVFRYSWSFAQNKNLNHILVNAKAGVFPLYLSADARDVTKPGPDTVTVTVFSALRGPGKLDTVTTYTQPFFWVRNKLPVLLNWSFDSAGYSDSASYTNRNPRVGCKDPQAFSLTLTGVDPDGVGDCKKIAYSSGNLNSSLGNLLPETSCSDSKGVALPLTSPYSHGELNKDTAFSIDNKLLVDVWDVNDEYNRYTIDFKSRTNVLPSASVALSQPRKAYFIGAPVILVIRGKDKDGPVYNMRMSWGDGNEENVTLSDDNSHDVQETIAHVYFYPGKYLPKLHVSDDCGDEDSAVLANRDSIRVRYNTPPKAVMDTVTQVPGDSLGVRVKISVHDSDADLEIDSVRVILNWGDGKADTSMVHASFEAYKQHRYSTKPPVGGYLLILKATDSQEEQDVVTRSYP
jgi:hypothetical protein